MRYFYLTIALLGSLLATAHAADGSLPDGWTTSAIGESRGSASYDAEAGAFTVTGTGSVTHDDHQVFLVHRPMEGDFQFTVRLASTSEGKGLAGGLLLTQDLAGGNKYFAHVQRQAEEQPKWLRVIRYRGNAGTYHSHDGRHWMKSQSGSTLQSEEVQVGMYVEGRGDAEVTAVFDQLVIEPYDPPYYTAVIGNSLDGTNKSTVAMSMSSLYVATDGTCFTTSFFEEHGHCLSAYRDGEDVGPGGKTPRFLGSAIAGHGDVLFAALKREPGFIRLDRSTLQETSKPVMVATAAEQKGHREAAVRGLWATAEEVFVANTTLDRIQVYDGESLSLLREWDFQQPGAMTMDDAGRLWVVQEGWEDVVYDGNAEGSEPEIRALDPRSGEVLASFAGVEIPVALAFGRVEDRACLLVADNGDDQQIKLFAIDGDQPEPIGTIGERGGIYAEPAGVVADAKLNGITGVGIDAGGNIYVTSSGWPFMYRPAGLMANVTELKAFPPSAVGDADADALWHLKSSAYVFDGGALDPDTGDVYIGADERHAVEWHDDGTVDWRYAGYLGDRERFPEEFMSKRTRSSPRWQRFGDQDFLCLLDSDGLAIYRFEQGTETAIPCGHIASRVAKRNRQPPWPEHLPLRNKERKFSVSLWTDGRNGGPRDGHDQPEEHATFELDQRDTPGAVWDIDPSGDIYYTGYFSTAIVRVPFEKLVDGIPTFGHPEEVAFPDGFFDVRKVVTVDRDDGMLVAGATLELPGHPHDIRRQYHELATYRNWSGERELVNRIEMPHPGYGGGESDRSIHSVMQAGDFIFAGWRHGVVYVYDLDHGNEVTRFVAGPEANSISGAFDDNNSAITAYQRGDEYVVLAQSNENSRLLAYRWTPETTPSVVPDVAPSVRIRSFADSAHLEWGGRMGSVGILEGYHVYRKVAGEADFQRLTDEPHGPARYVDTGLADGVAASYRVSLVNAAGEGPLSDPVTVVPTTATAEALAADTTTAGDWRERYGTKAWHLGFWQPENNHLPAEVDIFGRYAGRDDKRSADADHLLIDPQDPTARIPFVWQARNGDLVFDVDVKDGSPYRLAIYTSLAENEHIAKRGKPLQVQILDAGSGEVLSEASYSGETPTAYLRWRVSGHVIVRVFADGGGWPAVQGVFVDPAP